MCARSSHRRNRAGLGLLGIVILFAGFSVPKDPGSSVRTSGPKLTVAYNFKWPVVDRQTSTAKFYDFALLCIFFKDLTVVNGCWAYTQFFTPPFDALSYLVVFGAYCQVANVDDCLFADLLIFSGCVCHLEQLHAQSPFLFPIVFSINFLLFSLYFQLKSHSAHFCGKSPSSGDCPPQIALPLSLGLKILTK